MASGGYFRHFPEQFYVWRTMVEMEVTYQTPVRLTTKLPILFFVHFLEDGALVPSSAFELLHRFMKILF